MTNGHKSNIRDVNASRPLWVRSRHAQCNSACPLYLRKRTKTDYDLQINRGADVSKVNAALIFAIAIVFVASSNTSVFAQPVSQGPPGDLSSRRVRRWSPNPVAVLQAVSEQSSNRFRDPAMCERIVWKCTVLGLPV